MKTLDGKGRKNRALDNHERYRAALLLKARRSLLEILITYGVGSVDEVRDNIDIPESVNPAFLGAVPKVLSNLGIIGFSHYDQSIRKKAHYRIVSFWYLVDNQKAIDWLNNNPELETIICGQGQLTL